MPIPQNYLTFFVPSSFLCTQRPETVAEGILKLATDASLVGATMTVTLKKGIDYWVFPDEHRNTSKL